VQREGHGLRPEGHYYGSRGVEKHLVYVVQTDEGQETLTPREMEAKYGWKNDPSRAQPPVTDVPAGK